MPWVKGFLPQTPSMRFLNGNLKPRFPFQSIHFVYWLNLLFLLHVFLTIEAIYVLLYCSLSDNASKRTKCRFLSRAEGRREMLGVDGSKYANDLFIQSLLLLIFPRAQRSLLICQHSRLNHAKQNFVIYGGCFSGQEILMVVGFDSWSF